MSELSSTEADSDDWINRSIQDGGAILPPLRIGGFEKLRIHKCTL
jgi:hypothetical protein